MPTKAPVRDPKPSAHPVRDAADSLFRTAQESCHQHERLAKVLALGVDDLELELVGAVTDLVDHQLAQQTVRYEGTASAGRGKVSDECWHSANALWMACREYCRRHEQNDTAATKLQRHSAARLGELKMEYELEMSARMALKQALVGYAKLRPEIAERRGVPTPI